MRWVHLHNTVVIVYTEKVNWGIIREAEKENLRGENDNHDEKKK